MNSTGTEPKTCTAVMNQNTGSPDAHEWPCTLPKGHGGDHEDDDGDRWNIRYA